MSRGENNGKAQVRWTKEMDRVLIDTLEEQIAAGNKGDNEWKTVALQQVKENIRSKLDMEVSVDNVKTRLKTWKESYAAMSYLLNRSGFGRNLTNNTLTAPDSVWKDFLKHNPQFKKYRDKSLDTYDEIGTIIGNDQATGSEAQTAAVAESNLSADDTMPNLPMIGYYESSSVNDGEGTSHANDGEGTSHANNGEGTRHANNNEGTSHADNSEGTTNEPNSRSNATPSTTKDNVNNRKRKNREDAVCKKESMSQMAEGITSIANHMIQRDMKPDIDVLFSSLRELKHISSVMRVKLVEYLVNDATKTKMFFKMNETEQLDWCSIRFPAQVDG